MHAPVVLFVYNRYEHAKTTIEALSKNDYAKDSTVYIFSDGPKNDDSIVRVKKVREYVNSMEVKEYFKDLIIIESPVNIGLANSIINGVTRIINQFGRVIVLEDDAVPTVDFLRFMNAALDFYESDQKILTIGGHSYDLELPNNYQYSVYPLGRSSSYAWGCWKDRWNNINWKINNYNRFKYNLFQRIRFNKFGNDRSAMLDAQMVGNIDSWAIRFCYHMYINELFAIIPFRTKIKNIGFDGSGTHCGSTSNVVSDIQKESFDSTENQYHFTHFDGYNEDLRTQFVKHYNISIFLLIYFYLKNVIFRIHKNSRANKFFAKLKTFFRKTWS